MNREQIIYVVLLLVLVACAAPNADPWRSAAHKPLDTGSHVWWEQTKRGW